MYNVYSCIAALDAISTVKTHHLLKPEEKKVFEKAILDDLPSSLMVPPTTQVLIDIVVSKLILPSIKPKDEEPIDSTNNRPKPQEAPVPRTYYKGKSQDKKSSTPL